ncbi:hypothetical protein CARUB_v10006191mg [Capsella rubella]|uniref:Uncharacterized protein n=1 Tax=Capsella rubella TaxID=81985 RepID=R0F7D1_9BRAS|nr:uncharacterized protein At3g27210 [Capsella rubella]EOA17797.1 hypothetical protein CARUB_v10006191mg [Capsella rubella]
MMSNDSSPVNHSPETAEENGGVIEKPSVLSSSTKRISESPVKENLAPADTSTMVDNGLSAHQVKPRWSFSSSKRSFGSSKDDTFYESHQWLQSDSEDDFYSVHGDFTPSLGNTPKCSFSEKLPRFHNPLFEAEKPRVSFSHSPAPRRKKLAELFRDSIREEREYILEEYSSENQSEKSKKSSSDHSNELKVIENSVKEKKILKSLNYHHRCLPRFPSFKGSLMEKRKKKKKKIHVK